MATVIKTLDVCVSLRKQLKFSLKRNLLSPKEKYAKIIVTFIRNVKEINRV